LDEDVQQLIVRLARENPHGGCQRIKGEFLRLDLPVSVTAIRTVLHRHSLDPALWVRNPDATKPQVNATDEIFGTHR